jgi:hypothetical protein
LSRVVALSDEDIEKAAMIFGEIARCILRAEIKKLSLAFKQAPESIGDHHANLKFSGFEMNSGKIENFHSGLSGRVGTEQKEYWLMISFPSFTLDILVSICRDHNLPQLLMKLNLNIGFWVLQGTRG